MISTKACRRLLGYDCNFLVLLSFPIVLFSTHNASASDCVWQADGVPKADWNVLEHWEGGCVGRIATSSDDVDVYPQTLLITESQSANSLNLVNEMTELELNLDPGESLTVIQDLDISAGKGITGNGDINVGADLIMDMSPITDPYDWADRARFSGSGNINIGGELILFSNYYTWFEMPQVSFDNRNLRLNGDKVSNISGIRKVEFANLNVGESATLNFNAFQFNETNLILSSTVGPGEGSLYNKGELNFKEASGGESPPVLIQGLDVVNEGSLTTEAVIVIESGNYTQESGQTKQGNRITTDELLINGGTLVAYTESENNYWSFGKADLEGDLTSNGSIIIAGDQVGTFNVDGNYVQGSDGVLNLDVSDVDELEYDKLAATGSATLDGVMELDFSAGYAAEEIVTLEVLTAENIFGEFESVSVVGLPDDKYKWAIVYKLSDTAGDSVALTITPVPLPAAAWLFLGGFLFVRIRFLKK